MSRNLMRQRLIVKGRGGSQNAYSIMHLVALTWERGICLESERHVCAVHVVQCRVC